MINTIGAMHAVLRAKRKRPQDGVNFRIAVKKLPRGGSEDDENTERPRREHAERGHKA